MMVDTRNTHAIGATGNCVEVDLTLGHLGSETLVMTLLCPGNIAGDPYSFTHAASDLTAMCLGDA